MMPALAKHRRKIRRKVNDCLYYRTRIDTFCFTLPRPEAQEHRQRAKELDLKLSVYARQAIRAYAKGHRLLPERIERELGEIRILEAQTCTALRDIDERLNRAQKSFIFDPLEAKKKLEKLIDRLEDFIRNPSSLDDC